MAGPPPDVPWLVPRPDVPWNAPFRDAVDAFLAQVAAPGLPSPSFCAPSMPAPSAWLHSRVDQCREPRPGALTPALAQYGAPVADVGLPGVSAWVVPLASAGPPAAAARLHVYEERAAAHAPTVCDPCRIIGAPLLRPGRLPRGARRALRPGPWGAGLGRRSRVPAPPEPSG
jgi:hypothetical protein